MKVLRYFLYFIYCTLLLYSVACHLDEKKRTPTPSTSKKQDSKSKSSKSLVWSGALVITNAGRYRNLLRENRRCDPCTNYFGPLDCKNFDSRADVEIQFDKNTELPAKAALRIKPHFSREDALPIFGYIGVCGFSISPLVPIELTGTAKYLNDYRGFHVQFTGSTGFGGGLSYVILRSESTTPIENGVLDVNIYYGGSANQSFEFGTAELENPDLENLYPGLTGGR